MQYWSAPIGKNTSHRAACEHAWENLGPRANPVIVCLDCDNIIGESYIEHVAKFMAECRRRSNYESLLGCKGLKNQGLCGRNACFMRAFLKIGGYDESMLPMGAQDTDLMSRLNATKGANGVYQQLAGKPHDNKNNKHQTCKSTMQNNKTHQAKRKEHRVPGRPAGVWQGRGPCAGPCWGRGGPTRPTGTAGPGRGSGIGAACPWGGHRAQGAWPAGWRMAGPVGLARVVGR